eukprot:6749772-Alexandrium_andersonii.AAC.1
MAVPQHLEQDKPGLTTPMSEEVRRARLSLLSEGCRGSFATLFWAQPNCSSVVDLLAALKGLVFETPCFGFREARLLKCCSCPCSQIV